jgi:4-amino-4-deoxy-L-arabinose transferase-like glycosyltransferase
MEVRDRRATLGPILLALLPLLPSWWYLIARPCPPMSVDDDSATIEMATRRVLHGTQLVGVYSRFGWSHPGPMPLALMAPVYALSGQRTAGMAAAALLLSTFFVGAAAWAAARLLGARRGLLAAAGLALLLVRMGPGWPAHEWPPHAVILPMALLVFLALGVAREGLAWLPACALVATYLVQAHVGTALAVAVLVLAALALASRSGRRLVAPVPLLLTAFVLAALWAPPVLEQWRGTADHPGNLARLARFFLNERPEHAFGEVFGRLAHELGSVPVALGSAVVPSTSDRRDVGAGVSTLLLCALLPLALVAARRWRDDDAAALAWLALAGAGASLLSGFRVVGEVLDYILVFASAFSFAGWTAVALAATRTVEERGRGRFIGPAAAVVGGLCALANLRGLAREQPIPIATLDSVRTFTNALKAHLSSEGIRKPLVRLRPGEPWVPAAGALLELDRAGIPFSVEEDWTFMFGASRRPAGDEDGTVWFVETPPEPDLRLLAENGKTKLYATPRKR